MTNPRDLNATDVRRLLRRKHDEADLESIVDLVDWLKNLLLIYGNDDGFDRCLAEARDELAAHEPKTF